MDSMQSVTSKEMEEGYTYLDAMKENLVKLLSKELRNIADKIENGTCVLTEDLTVINKSPAILVTRYILFFCSFKFL